jgi:hypothetical protein
LLNKARVNVDGRLLRDLLGFDVLVNVFDQVLAAFAREGGYFVDRALVFETLDKVRHHFGARIGTKVEWLSVLQAGNFKGLANLAWGLDAFQNKRNASFWTQETGIAYRINKDLEVRATFNRASHAFTSAATHTESQLTLHQYF